MASNPALRTLPIAALSLLGLASCSLPSDQAWRQIRQEGLITYLMRNDGQAPASSSPMLKANGDPAASSIAATPTTGSNVVADVPPPSQLAGNSLPIAQAVPGLDGYVRSPFTNPPRLVDVRGMASGSKVVCPYTRRPFLVPQMSQATSAVASAPETTPAPAPRSEPKPQPAPRVVTPPPQQPTKVAANTAAQSQPAPAPAPTPKPAPQAQAKTTPPAAPKETPAPQAATPKPAATGLPFGVPIPGRPGFVNSPYAAKHQLVDVTGLPTGMEVKCPYTGKLFRVPPQANNPQQ